MATQPPTHRSPRAAREAGWNRPVAGWVGGLLLVLVALGLLFLYRTMRFGAITSESMEPTLKPGDYYVIRIDAYRQSKPEHGDIVVIRHPQKRELLVKRVVGVEGDQLFVLFGRVWRNGAWIDEPYIAEQPGVRERPSPVVVPKGQLYLLGDNRNHSEDSRDMGTLPAEDVVGRVSAVVLPWRARRSMDRPAAVSRGR